MSDPRNNKIHREFLKKSADEPVADYIRDAVEVLNYIKDFPYFGITRQGRTSYGVYWNDGESSGKSFTGQGDTPGEAFYNALEDFFSPGLTLLFGDA